MTIYPMKEGSTQQLMMPDTIKKLLAFRTELWREGYWEESSDIRWDDWIRFVPVKLINDILQLLMLWIVDLNVIGLAISKFFSDSEGQIPDIKSTKTDNTLAIGMMKLLRIRDPKWYFNNHLIPIQLFSILV